MTTPFRPGHLKKVRLPWGLDRLALPHSAMKNRHDAINAQQYGRGLSVARRSFNSGSALGILSWNELELSLSSTQIRPPRPPWMRAAASALRGGNGTTALVLQ